MPRKIGELPPIKSLNEKTINVLVSPSILEERLQKERKIELLDVSDIKEIPCSFGNSAKIRNFSPEEIEESILNTLAKQQFKYFKHKEDSTIELIDAGMKICARVYQYISQNISQNELPYLDANEKLKTNLIQTLRELWVPDIIGNSIVKYLFIFLKDDKQLPWETFKQFFQNTLNVKILTAIFLLTQTAIQQIIFVSLHGTKYEKKYIGDYVSDQNNYLKRMIQNIIVVVDKANSKNKKLKIPGLVLNETHKNRIDLIMLSEILFLDLTMLNIGYDTYEVGKTIWEVFFI